MSSTPVATMLLPDTRSPLRPLEPKNRPCPTILKPLAPNDAASSSGMTVLSSSDAEISPVTVERGALHERPRDELPGTIQLSQGDNDNHIQPLVQAGGMSNFATPTRFKTKPAGNAVVSSTRSANRRGTRGGLIGAVDTSFEYAGGSSGNAVTPSTRDASTPGSRGGSSCGEKSDNSPTTNATAETTPVSTATNPPDRLGGGPSCDAAISENDSSGSHEGLTAQIKAEPFPQSPPMGLEAATSTSLAPSIDLGPRTTPRTSSTPAKAVSLMPRKTPSRSPVVPRRLNSDSDVKPASTPSSAYAGFRDEPSSPTVEDMMPPSHFLAAKISPLRSSLRPKKSESQLKERGSSSPPSSSKFDSIKSPARGLPDIADAKLLSPCGLFLSPRTPKPISSTERDSASKSACLTPSNFASDFGKGHEHTLSFDASNVFAWLNSPTGQGLFSPSGGLTTLSVTNTPRGMYGFGGGGGKTPNTPSALLAPSATSSSFFFSDVEGLPNEIASPKELDNQRSMICISPLASQKAGVAIHKRASAPDTPMSINFSEVFASPRLSTPRGKNSAKKDSNTVHSPAMNALHTAERDLMEDEDLQVLLQLAGTTTPGGRPIPFKTGMMSPLLTSSLRRVSAGSRTQRESEEPPSSLQLPIISGSSTTKKKSSPPQLSIRSSSSGVLDSSRESSSKSKSKKRKASDMGLPNPPQAEGVPSLSSVNHQHQMSGYPHPNMLHYRHNPAPSSSHSAQHASGVYYHQPHHHHYTRRTHMSAHSHLPPRHHSMGYPQPPSTHQYSYSEHQSTNAPDIAQKRQQQKASKKNKRNTPKDDPDYEPGRNHSSSRKSKKSSKPAAKKPKSSSNAIQDPEEKARVAAAIQAVNDSGAGGNEKAAALAAAILRGVTMRPSGKWQAQLYYAGKSRYIGVFDSREKAALAYEIAREVLKTEKGMEPTTAEETEKNVNLARKAAFAGVNEIDPRDSSSNSK